MLCSVELDRRINALRRLAPGAVERLEDDPDSAAMVERHLQVAIQAAIGVAAWAIADRCRRQPDSDADTFYVLAEEGLQDRPAAFRFADMAGHQNVLVRACPKANQATKARHATEGLSGLTELAVRCGAQVGGRRP